LRVDTTTRDGDGSAHEKPHKPLLLLAVSICWNGEPTATESRQNRSLTNRKLKSAVNFNRHQPVHRQLVQ